MLSGSLIQMGFGGTHDRIATAQGECRMNMNYLSAGHIKRLLAVLLVCCTGNAFAWSATFLGADHWVITCANGLVYSYNGSSAGLDVVGPALCPNGIISGGTNGGGQVKELPQGVTRGVSPKVDRDLFINRKEIGDSKPQAIKRYPPHGYPCLGCEPCPPDYCDIVNKFVVRVPPVVRVGQWR
jgi:hypothetical protein